MVLITHTNIIVDDFQYGKKNPFQTYIFFLTHFHSDHWAGLNPSWNFGKIYCSHVTKKLVMNKFPNIKHITSLDLNVAHRIYLNESKSLHVDVHFFDANHCPGSVMILFQGYMGTILHTGDFRFHQGMIFNNPVLFPIALRNREQQKCSINIDELIFDDTFCDPLFKFPTKDEALKSIIQIIEKDENKNKKVYLCIDSIGKEDLMVDLAEYFRTLIVVDEERYRNICLMDYRIDLFTTNPTEGFIEVIKKDDRKQRAEDPDLITITPAAWANIKSSVTKDGKHYIVLYSLHSSFQELETFVKSIQPGVLKKVNKNRRVDERYQKLLEFSNYLISLKKLKQRGYEEFLSKYANPENLSPEYKKWTSKEAQSKLALDLGLKCPPEKQLEMNTRLFEAENSGVFKRRNKLTTGAKLRAFEDNKNLTSDQIKVLRKKNILLQSASTSYSELYDTAYLFRENGTKLRKAQSFQFNTEGFESHTDTFLPKGEFQVRKRSNSENLEDNHNENSNFILINSQEVWDVNVNNIKHEEMEEEKMINVGDLTSERTVAEAIPCSQPRIPESMYSVTQHRSQDQNIMQEEPMLPPKLPEDAMDIEHENKANQQVYNNSEVFARATILTDAPSINFEEDDEEEKNNAEGPVVLEKMKDIPLVRRRSILKRGNANDSGSEKGSVKSRSRSRSNSRSEKRVQFQGLSEEEKESETEQNPIQKEKKEQKKSQISMISKLLQQRLEKEEEDRKSINAPPETKETAEITAGTFQRTDAGEQQKTISKLLHLNPEGNAEEPIQSTSIPKASLGVHEASADLIHQHMANHYNFALKAPANSHKIKESKIVTKEAIKPSESQKSLVGKAEPTKIVTNEAKKQAPGVKNEKSSRRNLFEDTEPDNPQKGKLLEEKKSNGKKDDKMKKKPGASPFEETMDNFSSAKKTNEPKRQLKDQQEVNKPKEVVSSKAQNTFLKGHFKDDADDDPAKKKNLFDKILKGKDSSPNKNDPSRDYLQQRRNEDSNPRNFSVLSESTEDNSKSIHQEIEEFLQKVREKRNQEKNPTEEQSFYEEPDHRKGKGYHVDDDEEEDDDGLLVPTKNYYEKNQNKTDSKRSKISVRNGGSMDISLEFDDNKKAVSGNTKTAGNKSGKPIKKIIIEPTPTEDDDGYEEIILVRRKVKGNNTDNSSRAFQQKHRTDSRHHDEAEYEPPQAIDAEQRKQLQKNSENRSSARSSATKSGSQVHARDSRYATRYKKKEANHKDFDEEEVESSIEEVVVESDPEPQPKKKIKTSSGAIPSKYTENVQKSQVTTRAEAKKDQEAEKSSATVRRLLEGKPKPTTQSKNASDPEKQLTKNKRGEELQPLKQKLARKNNLIEEDDSRGDPDEDHDKESNQHYFEDRSSDAINKLQALNNNYLFTGIKQKRKPRRRVSKSLPGSQNSQESLTQRAKPLVSFPAGVVLTQSQHVRKLKKVQHASQTPEKIDPKAKKALNQLFGLFIDKNTL